MSEISKERESIIFKLITQHPGLYIRYYRNRVGLTQVQLAEQLSEDGVSVASIQGHEYSEHKPSRNFVRMYAKFFNKHLPADTALDVWSK